jgi:formiminotetrahydrofolate cyclodeaminase
MTNAPATMSAMEGQGPVEMQLQLSRAKDMLAKKDTEIKVLRKESDWMKRELRERDEEIKALKATVKTSPKKKAEAYRTK